MNVQQRIICYIISVDEARTKQLVLGINRTMTLNHPISLTQKNSSRLEPPISNIQHLSDRESIIQTPHLSSPSNLSAILTAESSQLESEHYEIDNIAKIHQHKERDHPEMESPIGSSHKNVGGNQDKHQSSE